MNYEGVFFDFDYTLGDSTPAITEGYRRGFQALGHEPPTVEQVRPTIGLTLMDGYTQLTGDSSEEHRREFYRQFQLAVGKLANREGQAIMIEGTQLFPGAVELLEWLRECRVRTAIVSTKPGITLRQIFAFRKLDHLLELVIGGDEVTQAKPDPEGLNLALERLGLTAERTLFCGDTVIDAATARAAGCSFAAVLNGTTPRAAFANYPHVHIANNLEELKGWLERTDSKFQNSCKCGRTPQSAFR